MLDLTVEGRNAGSSTTAYTGFGERPSMAGPDQVNILNLPLPDFDTISGQNCIPLERLTGVAGSDQLARRATMFCAQVMVALRTTLLSDSP